MNSNDQLKKSLASRILSLPNGKEILASLSDDELLELRYMWEFWARPNQLPPSNAWTGWLVEAGRGFGKNRLAAEYINRTVEERKYRRIGLVARIVKDVRDVMIEGDAGILTLAHPKFRPLWEPAKRRLTWPNGAQAITYTSEEPDALRGPSHDFVWADEIASWQYQEAWDNAMFGLRLTPAQWLATTTPKVVPLIKKLHESASKPSSGIVITHGTTYDNIENLAENFKREVLSRYEGTRIGRQELLAELLVDNPDALWKRIEIDYHRVTTAPDMKKIVVAIDPSISADENSAECGIIVAGVAENGHGYVLADSSRIDTPLGWARTALGLWKGFRANRIIAEKNQGGLMVETTIRAADIEKNNPIVELVQATRGKYVRAEPVSTLYEQGLIHHLGTLAQLEDQLVTWVPGEDSPDRLDALVWAFTNLMVDPKQKRYGRDYGIA